MATVTRREIRKRGFFGHLFKWLFVIFNILMIVWLVSYWSNVGQLISGTANDSGRTGATIGATLGTGLIAFFWVAGAVVLGLFTMLTRGKITVIEERSDS